MGEPAIRAEAISFVQRLAAFAVVARHSLRDSQQARIAG
jgi:predicted membrane chloride channel (bestrophin family)